MSSLAEINVMTAKDLTQYVIHKKPLFILDVRNQSDFDDWKVEGERIDAINIPYFDLLEGVESALEQIPKGVKVLVVCAKEGSSIFVAEQLVEAGLTEVSYLQGGMKSWSEYLEPVKIGELKDGGTLYQFVRIGKGCLSYMVISDGEAAVIDTLRLTDIYERFAKDKGARITHTLDTHLHADHISGGRKLADQVGAKYWLPPKDATDITFDYMKLEVDQQITVGNTSIQIQPIYSPGHTIGSTSLIVDEKYLLTGDILFLESIGRPDLAGQAEDWVFDLRETLYTRYSKLSKKLVVLPAHFGKVSELGEEGKVLATLGDLYASNQGLQIADESEFRRTVTENLPPQPHAYQEIRETNKGLINPNDDEQREMEMGPNRCAVN